MTYTPQQRLDLYEKILPYFNGENRFIRKGYSRESRHYVMYICVAIDDVCNENTYISDFPEILTQKPQGKSIFCSWYTINHFGVDHNRVATITNAITTVKKLIQ